ncbi:phytoene desaturase family protein [Paenibacillus sp. PL2-23]|uniref:phytoene desaturase family protein n=1 Tax=Paenibacillus sp. PL2-23 TaxID=2100729 RepID=UPI0030FA1EC1
MNKVIVIGAGIGGLSTAIRLTALGYKVTVVEQQPSAGGKLQRVEEGGYRFDRGPSTITMPQAFQRVFESAGKRMEDYLDLTRLEPGTRNVFADGTVVDFTSDRSAMEEQIAVFSPKDALAYRSFMAESKELFDISDRLFLNHLLTDWRSKADPRLLAGLLRVRPLTSLHRLLRRYFQHPNTLAMFGRYATYVGSSPRQAPAIFAMLPHLEQQLGVYHVKGGTYRLVEALRTLALELGVDFRYGVKVTAIRSNGRRVVGVGTQEGELAADIVVANGDLLSISQELLPGKERPSMPDRKIQAMEPSLSGFVVLAGVRRKYKKQLLQHTVFFPEYYELEFEHIFHQQKPPADPAVYVCHSGYSEPGMSPEGGSNLFLLANAPYTGGGHSWQGFEKLYAKRLLKTLERRGLEGLTEGLEVMQTYTPEQLQRDTSAYRGAIYGISSNSARQTFFRPSNRGDLSGLWFVGGTTHPGGGTPLVALSGLLVADEIAKRAY